MPNNHSPLCKRFPRFYQTGCRLVVFFAGLWIMALGTVFSIQSGLGVAPWDVLHIGLAHVTKLTIGLWVITVGIGIVAVTCWLNRSLPQWGTVGNMIFVGLFIDMILYLHVIPEVHLLIMRFLYLLLGMFLTALGAGLYIAPKAGAGPRDGLMLALANRTGWSIRLIRTIMEIIVGGIGWFLGGPVQIGTLFFCFLTGPFMQWSIHICERWMQLILKRGGEVENLYKGAIRAHDHDGLGC